MLNFKISELINSKVTKINNISNIPDASSLDNLLNLIFYCLQPVRNLIKKPMIITSGYRCKKLNKIIGGSINSQHTLGKAADFIVKGISPKNIVDVVEKSDIVYDQLICEYNKWVHISYNDKLNRRETLFLN